MRTVLGKVGMTPKGVYNNTTKYVRLDVVTKDGQSYVCIKDCNGINVTNTTYWQLIASKGDMPINGIDYNTEEDKQVFKEAVVEDSKTEMDNYTTEKKEELDAYTADKKTELDEYKTTLETEMSTTKDSLTGEITATATDETNKFNTNAESKTNAFNDNATEKTTNYNTNAETKTKEYNDNSTTKVEEYNTNATNKVAEFNNNVDSLENELTELANQMPWNTTEVAESIHVEDSAKYSRNKLDVFGNLEQETREGYNVLNTENLIEQNVLGIDIIKNFNGTININGTSKNKGNVKLLENLNENLSGNYTLIVKLISGSLTGASIRISIGNSLHNNAGSEIGRLLSTVVSSTNNKFIVTGEITDILDNVYMYINTGSVFNLCKFEIYLVKGTYTEDTIPAYEPYGAMPSIDYPSMPQTATGVQKITRYGKNFWKFECAKITPSSKSWFFFDGKVGAWGTNIQNKTKSYIKLKKGFYAFSYINKINCNLHIIDNNENILINSAFPKTIELKKDTYIIPRFYNIESNVETYVEGLQIEKVSSLSDTATVYEPYKEEVFELDLGTTELCKITDENGNVVAQDRSVYREVDGVKKWQWEKKYSKLIFDENSNWKLESTNVFYVNKVITDAKTSKDTELKCNIFGTLFSASERILISNTKKFNLITNKIEHTLDAIKAYCANTNIVIYYPLAETQYIDCTAEQSAVLDKLYKLQLEQGTNNIFVESENGVTTELQLTYMQDLQSKLNQLEAMIVSNASEEV